MSRTNISEVFSRLQNRSPSDHLNEDIDRLRKTTRIALQITEHEVENLRQQRSINTEAAAQHDEVVKNLQKTNKAWQERCLTAEAKLQETLKQRNGLHCHKRPSFPSRAQSRSGKNDSFPNRAQSWSCRYDSNDNTDLTAEAKLEEIPEQENTLHYSNMFLLPIRRAQSWSARNYSKDNTDQRTNIDLALKISSRDQAISSLEEALNEMSKRTLNMQAEIYDAEEKQRIKEKEVRDSHVQKEENLNEIIDSLRKELASSVSRNET